MFDSLRRLTQGPDGLPKIPFMKQDMDRIMEKITADIDTLESDFNSAVRFHADHCLLAAEGGEAEAKARDKAHTKFIKAERALADARAAHTAAERRKAVDAEKDKAKELAERQKRVAALQKKVAATCKTLDDLLDQVAATVILRTFLFSFLVSDAVFQPAEQAHHGPQDNQINPGRQDDWR